MFHGDVDQDTAGALLELRRRIAAGNLPPSSLDETIKIATWNIREFGKKRRTDRAIHLIAEVVSEFDLVALVELRSNLTDLQRVMQIMGPYWRAVFSDFTDDPAGNDERVGFVYDSRAVRFTGLAAEADPARKKEPDPGDPKSLIYREATSWWRSPYMVSFQAGNFDFILLAVHIQWGSEAGRVKELASLADWVHARQKHKFVADKDLIVLGDFNIPKVNDKFFKAIARNGLQLPPGLATGDFPSNVDRTMRYDQILHYPLHSALYRDRRGKYVTPAGVLDVGAGGYEALFKGVSKPGDLTYQMSDHLPLWMALNVWADDLRLDQILSGQNTGRA